MSKHLGSMAALAVAGGLLAGYQGLVVPWMYRWGATASEVAEHLPGDELVRSGTRRTTRAVTVDAPAEAVWPWLAQIGEDRAGFYSYDRLERLAGAHIHNADTIHPEWQELRVGDTVWLARRYGTRASQLVAEVEPKSHLVLVSTADFGQISDGAKASGAWAFVLQPAGHRTRLLVRGSGTPVGHPVFDIAHFIMERAMMRGLRERAERTAAPINSGGRG